MPICDHRNIKGHAVRAAYLMSGATDVAAETQDPALLKMINRVWRNTTRRNMYITGGIGPSASNEGFTHDYDLPNLTAYQETCASVALAQWNHRLALLYGDAPLRRRLRALALQRRARGRLARRQAVLLREPAGEPGPSSPLALVRLRLLSAERGADPGLAGRLRLRRRRRRPLGQPLHPGLGRRRPWAARR